jgi:phosphoglycerate dehydrogenase-like enzyme
MTQILSQMRIAILDDYQRVAMEMADWSWLQKQASIEVFSDTIVDPDLLVARLLSFDILCVMRERTPLPRNIIERLPNLKLIVSTGRKNASIAADAAEERGIVIKNTGGGLIAPTELTWALIQSSARNLTAEATALRAGGWQHTVGDELAGMTLGILGMGRIGSKIAQIARLFNMKVITWRRGAKPEGAEKFGVTSVRKDEFFSTLDVLSVHLVLAESTRGLVGAEELAQMKPSAWLINTSRGAIVNEVALIGALKGGKLKGAALDVFDQEPLPIDHPFRLLPNVVALPHLGYVSRQQYALWFGETVEHITTWLHARDGNF